MGRKKLQQLVTTGSIEERRSRGKQRGKMLGGLTNWLKVGRVTQALKATRNRDAWKVMITYAREHGTRLID